jgi:glycosyltransferase involved in cell wall biosynthesis
MISVLILTRNEESDLPGCLASVKWCDDIHVYDSLSTDTTVEIARAHGAIVTSRGFDNWASHQNWGLQNIRFKYPWVLYIDADERPSEELCRNMLAAVQSPADNVAFQVERRDFFLNTWLRHVQATPFYIRLFRPECMRYGRLVNPVSIPSGPVGTLQGYLDHFPFSKGLGHWIDRHNKYSAFEAMESMKNTTGEPASLTAALFGREFHVRRYHQKQIFYKLPARPIVRFLALYVAKRGFLDGKAGFTYAILQGIYEFFIVEKAREVERERASPNVDRIPRQSIPVSQAVSIPAANPTSKISHG